MTPDTPQAENWVEKVQIVDDESAFVTVKKRNGRRVTYRIPRKLLIETDEGHEAAIGPNPASDPAPA
jgi:hypothetical protein